MDRPSSTGAEERSIPPNTIQPEEAVRRKKVIQEALESFLTGEQMAHAILLCEHEFSADPSFSTTSFCQRLVETLPDLQLSAQDRLMLLRTVRQNAQELGVQNLTSIVGVSRQLLQASPIQEAEPPSDPKPASLQPPPPPRWVHYVKHPSPTTA